MNSALPADDMAPSDMVQVVMMKHHAMAYEKWLHANRLHLFKIPTDSEDLPTFGVGIMD